MLSQSFRCWCFGLTAALAAIVAMPTTTSAFWASHGSGGSYGGGSYGSGGSWGGGSAGYGSAGYGSAGYTRASYGSAGYGSASAGSRGSYGGGSYGSASAGSRGSYGPGPLQRLAMHFRAKRAARASAGSHGSAGYSSAGSHGSAGSVVVSSGSHGSAGGSSYRSAGSHGGHSVSYSSVSYGSAGSSVSYGSAGSSSVSYGSAGSYSSSYSTESYSTPMYSESYGSGSSYSSAGGHVTGYGGDWSVNKMSEAQLLAEANADSKHTVAKPVIADASGKAGSGMLSVIVPANAKVFVNGRETSSTGTQRQFVSHGLQAGDTYSYRVRVEYQENGKPVVKDKVATLTSGSDIKLSFAASKPAEMTAEKEVATKLTLNVPANASVKLAGAETKQTGNVREFITTRLPAGQTWADYQIEVEFEQNGRKVARTETITLRGGEPKELTFGTTGPKLAAN